MTENFEKAFVLVIKREGGYVNHEMDKGGPTNYGITLQTLSAYRASRVEIDDVVNLTLEEAMRIYKEWYWDTIGLDDVIDHRVSSMIFDQAVNKGTRTATKLAQESLGVQKDGVMGPITLAAINAADPILLGLRFIKSTQIHYAKIVQRDPNQRVFLIGWLKRTHHLLDLLK